MSPRLTLPDLGQALAPLRRFCVWWLSELEAALLELGELAGMRWRRRAKLKPCHGGFEVTVYRGSAIEKEYFWSAAGEEPLVAPPSLELEVPDGHVLVRTFTFPAGARARLASAVVLKLLRESPLPVEQLIWAIGPVERPTRDSIKVSVALVRRALLESWKGVIEKSGASPRRVMTEKSWSFDTRRPDGSGARAFITRHAAGLLTAAFLLGVVCLGILWQQRMQREDAWLRDSMHRVEAAAAEDVVLRARLMREVALARDFKVQSRAPDILRFLETLNERIPKSMWVKSLGAKDASVHVTVVAPIHAEVAKLFGGLPEVERVAEDARAPVSADEERIEISLQLRERSGS